MNFRIRFLYATMPADGQETTPASLRHSLPIQSFDRFRSFRVRAGYSSQRDAEPWLIQRLLRSTLDEFGARFPDTAVEVEVQPALPPVATNADTIDQVLWNLLTNARKYGPPRGPITVRACEADGWTEVKVIDNGRGVALDEMDRLFQPYFRSAASASHAAGLGLGLSVCKTLIEAQGGKIWARRLEPGMEFGFGLPALAARE